MRITYFICLILVSCGGSKHKTSEIQKERFKETVKIDLSETVTTDLELNTIRELRESSITYTPIDPAKPMYTPNEIGGYDKTMNAAIEKKETNENTSGKLIVKSESKKKDRSKTEVSQETKVEKKEVERSGFNLFTRIILWIISGIIIFLILYWKKRKAILKSVRKWIGI